MLLGEPLDGAGKHFSGMRGCDPARVLPSKNSERELTGRVTFVGRHCEDFLGDMSDRCVLIETFCVVQLRRHVLEQGQ